MRIFILLFFTLNFLTAQKVIKKSIVDAAISSFQIDVSNCFKVAIQTSKNNEVIVEATIDGEYRKDLILNLQEEGSSVYISAGFHPNFKNPNDKLSAHKVVSIALEIILPAHKNVIAFGTSCTIHAMGAYNELNIRLNDGASHLTDIQGFAKVITQSGDISVKSKKAEIRSISKYGKVTSNEIPKGNNKYILNTVTGNIFLKRIE